MVSLATRRLWRPPSKAVSRNARTQASATPAPITRAPSAMTLASLWARDAVAVKKLFDEIGPKFQSRFGGYTRVVKLGFRLGDNTPVSLIEFVGVEHVKPAVRKPKTAAKKTPKKKDPGADMETKAAEETGKAAL